MGKEKLSVHEIRNVSVPIPTNDDDMNMRRIYGDAFLKLQSKIGGDVPTFPRKQRFCSLVDRRGDKKEQELTMWEAPEDCRDIPPDYKAGWFFNASSTSIIPHAEYKAGAVPHAEKNNKTNENVFMQNKSLNNMMTLSFHAMTSDEIRCYLTLGGGMMRFMAKDITGVFGKLFDMNVHGNKEFIAGQTAQKLIADAAIPDARFEKFRKYVNAK